MSDPVCLHCTIGALIKANIPANTYSAIELAHALSQLLADTLAFGVSTEATVMIVGSILPRVMETEKQMVARAASNGVH